MSVETPNPTERTELQNIPWEIERGGRDVAASYGGGRE